MDTPETGEELYEKMKVIVKEAEAHRAHKFLKTLKEWKKLEPELVARVWFKVKNIDLKRIHRELKDEHKGQGVMYLYSFLDTTMLRTKHLPDNSGVSLTEEDITEFYNSVLNAQSEIIARVRFSLIPLAICYPDGSVYWEPTMMTFKGIPVYPNVMTVEDF